MMVFCFDTTTKGTTLESSGRGSETGCCWESCVVLRLEGVPRPNGCQIDLSTSKQGPYDPYPVHWAVQVGLR